MVAVVVISPGRSRHQSIVWQQFRWNSRHVPERRSSPSDFYALRLRAGPWIVNADDFT